MGDINELLDRFYVYMAMNQGRSDSTVKTYAGHLQRLKKYCEMKNIGILTVEQAELEDFTGLYMHKMGLTPASRKVVVSAVRSFYKWLDRGGVIKSSPARNIKQPSTGKKLGVKMDLEWMAKLIMAPGITSFRGIRDTAILTILAGCGCRPSGITSLNQKDLVFVIEDEKEKLYIRFREKGKKERVVPAPDECRALIRAYLGHGFLKRVDRALPDGDQVLFIKQVDRTISLADFYGEHLRMNRNRVYKIVQRYGDKIGMPKEQRQPKALRHLFGTELHEEDIDIRIGAALMGHVDIKSQDMYTHLATRKLRKSIEKGNPLAKIKIPLISDLAAIQ